MLFVFRPPALVDRMLAETPAIVTRARMPHRITRKMGFLNSIQTGFAYLAHRLHIPSVKTPQFATKPNWLES
jgi:hypothetical protein